MVLQHFCKADLLATCHMRVPKTADKRGLMNATFQSIPAGIYGYPKNESTTVVVAILVVYLKRTELPYSIILYCLDQAVADIQRVTFAALWSDHD